VLGSPARAVPARGRPKAKVVEGVTSHCRMRGIGELAVSARVSHCLQKSVERLRAQRSAPPVEERSKASPLTERVNGGSATKKHSARKRTAFLAVKRSRLFEVRRSSSRERRSNEQGVAGSVALRCERVVRRR